MTLAAAGSSWAADERQWDFRLPKESKVVYAGAVHLDDAGAGPGGMVYPAPNAAGMLLAVLTHSVLVESTKVAQRTRLQAEADKVLAGCEPHLSDFSHVDLLQRALPSVVVRSHKREGTPSESVQSGVWVMDTSPKFRMTQDGRALLLDNQIIVSTPAGTPVYRGTVTVVSASRASEAPGAFCAANAAEELKEESAKLWAESINIAARQVDVVEDGVAAPYKTFRYMEGGVERMERGQQVTQTCERLVLKTLRGEFLSVPRAQAPNCQTTVSSDNR